MSSRCKYADVPCHVTLNRMGKKRLLQIRMTVKSSDREVHGDSVLFISPVFTLQAPFPFLLYTSRMFAVLTRLQPVECYMRRPCVLL